jgi:hypothetical protein
MIYKRQKRLSPTGDRRFDMKVIPLSLATVLIHIVESTVVRRV